MTGHDQFREGVKSAVESGCFADDFETHPIGTAQRLKELEEQAIRHREDKAQAVADAVMRARREWAARAVQEPVKRKGIKPMRSAREAADDVSTPLMRD